MPEGKPGFDPGGPPPGNVLGSTGCLLGPGYILLTSKVSPQVVVGVVLCISLLCRKHHFTDTKVLSLASHWVSITALLWQARGYSSKPKDNTATQPHNI